MKTKISVKILTAIILCGFIIFVTFPLYWVLIISLEPAADFHLKRIFPSRLTLENFNRLISDKNLIGIKTTSFLVPLINSIFVSSVGTVLSMLICLPAGYALARFRIKWKEVFSTYVLMAYVFPPFILMTALYKITFDYGLHDKLIGLSLIHLIYMVPYCTWMLRGYFSNIPKEMEDAALIDGCSRVQTLIKVVLPISAPGVVCSAIFSFNLSWQDLLFGIITIDSYTKFTLPIALSGMVMSDFVNWQILMCGLFMGIVPPVFIYLLTQRFVVTGLTAGALKG